MDGARLGRVRRRNGRRADRDPAVPLSERSLRATDSFQGGDPQTYAFGVDERWKEKYGVWLVRNTETLYALVAVCTHLGCTPNWLAAQNKFKCPCHGSGYYMSGVNFEGPTPRPLERAEISVSPDDGQLIVDKATRYLYERGQWTDPKAFVKMV